MAAILAESACEALVALSLGGRGPESASEARWGFGDERCGPLCVRGCDSARMMGRQGRLGLEAEEANWSYRVVDCLSDRADRLTCGAVSSSSRTKRSSADLWTTRGRSGAGGDTGGGQNGRNQVWGVRMRWGFEVETAVDRASNGEETWIWNADGVLRTSLLRLYDPIRLSRRHKALVPASRGTPSRVKARKR